MTPATGPSRPGAGRQCAAVAAAAALLVLGCQWLTVRYNYQGNWTALFLTGSKTGVPAGKEFAGTYLHAGSRGYDGQFYRLIAHDPACRRGLARHIDDPRLRYQRILVPGLAYTVALGRAGWIDGAYVAVILGFILLGTYWTARWATAHGWPAAWGLVFLALPASMVSATRMTVDVALAALGCAWALYAPRRGGGADGDPGGALVRVPHPAHPTRSDQLARQAAAGGTGARSGLGAARGARRAVPCRLDSVALRRARRRAAGDRLGRADVAGTAARELRNRGTGVRAAGDPVGQVGHLVRGFGRLFSPLLLLLALAALARRKMLLAAPLALTLPRMLAELVSPALGVVRGMLA
jgi:hypothetical protein